MADTATAVATNKVLIGDFLSAMSSGDAAGATSFLDDAATWEVIDRNAKVLGKDELAAAITGFAGMCSKPLSLTPTTMTAEEDRVSVEARAHAVLANGREYDARVHFLFVVRDGRIHAGREYVDTAYAAATFAG